MIIRTLNSKVQGALLALIFILGLSGISWGAEFWLRAETLTKTMPDTRVITMWGFAQCTSGTYLSCTPATVPGSRLTVPAGDTVLTIHLRNNLTGSFVEPVSIVIPGLAPTTAMTPVKVSGRVRSFSPKTPADNATTVTYSWTMKPGTYLYESGYHPAVQVQMGLYGGVTSDAAAGQAYGLSTAYAAEAILLFSEIDPVLHGHVAAGTYGTPPPIGITSTVDYEPKYFLINGEPFTPAAPHIPAGISGQSLLLRFLSAGLKHRVPTIYGMNVSLVAEDGNPYTYPKEQYSLLLSPGKTMDALVMAAPTGEFPVYDRRLGLTNDTATSGGMLTYLSVTPDFTVAPTNLAAVINSGPLRITLTWNDASNNETSFVVWRSDNGGAFTQIGTLTRTAGQSTATGGTPTFNNTNAVAPLVDGHRYRYYVKAVNAVGASSPSNTVFMNYSVPVAPSSLAGTAVRLPLGNPLRSTEDRATLNWTDNSNNEANFQIQRATNSGFTAKLTSVTLGSNVTTFSQKVSRTQDFYYRVRARNLIGNSGWSNVVLVTTP